MIQVLEGLLGRVLEQLKYAEAKNGALATISGTAGMALIATFATRGAAVFSQHGTLFLWAAFFFLCASVSALWSFLPRLRNKNNARGYRNPEKANLAFFGDLAIFTEDQLLNEIAGALGSTSSPVGRFERDLANQIIANSQIVLTKLSRFRLSCFLLTAGIALVFVVLGLEVSAGLQLTRVLDWLLSIRPTA